MTTAQANLGCSIFTRLRTVLFGAVSGDVGSANEALVRFGPGGDFVAALIPEGAILRRVDESPLSLPVPIAAGIQILKGSCRTAVRRLIGAKVKVGMADFEPMSIEDRLDPVAPVEIESAITDRVGDQVEEALVAAEHVIAAQTRLMEKSLLALQRMATLLRSTRALTEPEAHREVRDGRARSVLRSKRVRVESRRQQPRRRDGLAGSSCVHVLPSDQCLFQEVDP